MMYIIKHLRLFLLVSGYIREQQRGSLSSLPVSGYILEQSARQSFFDNTKVLTKAKQCFSGSQKEVSTPTDSARYLATFYICACAI